MGLFNIDNLRTSWRHFLFVLACLFAAVSCLMPTGGKISSTSVSTGNPAGIRVQFKDPNGPAILSCRARLYAATQIPVPGFQPDPLAEFLLSETHEFRLGYQEIENIPDSLWSPGSTEGDSLFKFNIQLDGIESGALVRGMAYNKGNRTFSLQGMVPSPTGDSLLDFDAIFNSIIPMHVGLPEDSLPPDQYHYLFIPGTGYYSLGIGIDFVPIVPKGEYTAALLSLPKDKPIPYDQDSLPLIGIRGNLKYGSLNNTSLEGVIGWVPIPSSERLQRKWFAQQLSIARLSFFANDMPTLFTGNVELYASNQIPVPEFQPEPLKTFPLSRTSEFDLDSLALLDIPDSLWSAGSILGDSIVRFNIFLSGKDSGLFLPGFSFHLSSKSFARTAEGSSVKERVLSTITKLQPYETVSVHLDPETLVPNRPVYLFLPGSGIVGKGDEGSFVFKAPKGSYAFTLISTPDLFSGPSSVSDSLFLYGLRFETETGITSRNAISETSGIVATPKSLKP